MRKYIFLILFFIFTTNLNAACDDPLGDGVEYTKCKFSDGQDLKDSFLPNSNLTFAIFIKVNFDKSFIMN